jgi:DUF1680 family protein
MIPINYKDVCINDKFWNPRIMTNREKTLYKPITKENVKPVKITAIPYYAWDNRKPGQMRIRFRIDIFK